MLSWIDQKYITLLAPHVSQWKKKGPRTWNFRCPFCGDSQKSTTKARGYLYEVHGHTAYKCHNCQYSTGLSGVLRLVAPDLAKEYALEVFKERRSFQPERLPVPFPAPPPPVRSMPTWWTALPLLTDLSAAHPARQYAESRRWPAWTWQEFRMVEDFSTLETHLLGDTYLQYYGRLPKGLRILIPFYAPGTGELVGVSGRAVGPHTLRYATLRLVPDVPLIFGTAKYDPLQPTWVCEGPFDSTFLPNALAVGGTDMWKALALLQLPKTTTTFVFDHQPRNPTVIKQMRKVGLAGWPVVVWPEDWCYKDINEAVVAGVSPARLLAILGSRRFSGLAFQTALASYQRI